MTNSGVDSMTQDYTISPVGVLKQPKLSCRTARECLPEGCPAAHHTTHLKNGSPHLIPSEWRQDERQNRRHDAEETPGFEDGRHNQQESDGDEREWHTGTAEYHYHP